MTYNRSVYGSVVGDSFAGDQVVPFAGELWLDLRIAGILVGFVVIGALIAALQGRFERGATALEMYVTQFTAMWIAFLIIGSLEVVSQIFVYFFWPIYFLVGYQWLRRLPVGRSESWTRPGEPILLSAASGERRCPGCSSSVPWPRPWKGSSFPTPITSAAAVGSSTRPRMVRTATRVAFAPMTEHSTFRGVGTQRRPEPAARNGWRSVAYYGQVRTTSFTCTPRWRRS